MLPTTRQKTAKTAQTQQKQTAAEYGHMQKMHMLKTVNDAVLEYSTSTGKKKKTAQQELFTIEHLNQRKRTLCARDIFIHDKMQETNKGTCSHFICIVLGYPYADIHQTSLKESVLTL
jgi:hypothetical protein